MTSWMDRIFRHKRAFFFTILMLAVSGVLVSRKVPVALFPHVDFPRIVVDLDSGDRPAEQMAIEVTRVLEETVRLVPGVQGIRSETNRGTASVSVLFRWGDDLDTALLQVQNAVAQTLPRLPPGSTYSIRHMAPELTPVFAYSLTSKVLTPAQLQDIGRYQLSPFLTSIPGIQRVDVLGGETEEFRVAIDPGKLNRFRLNATDVSAAIAANSLLKASGRIEDEYKLFLIIGDSRLKKLEDIGEIVVKATPGRLVRVKDLAEVRRQNAPNWTRVTADGNAAVVLNIYQQPRGNTAELATLVKAAVAEFSVLLPKNVKLANWYDQSELILSSFVTVRDAIFVGVLLAAGVLFLFLKSVRMTLISLTIVPVVISITILVMYALNESFNIMTLGGLAAAVGLIIDDAIVLLEHIARRIHESGGKEGSSVVAKASKEFTMPLLSSSAATLVIHIPPAFLTGATGNFFKALSLTMAISLVTSFCVSWILIPLIAEQLYKGLASEPPHKARVFHWFNRHYSELMRKLFARPRLVFLGLIPLIAIGVASYFYVGSGFMPEMDEGGFVLDYLSHPGTSVQETDRLVRQIEKILQKIPEVETYSRRTGLGLGGGFHAPNEGDFFIRLKPHPRRDISEVMDEVRGEVEEKVPGLEVEILQLMEDLIGDLSAVPQPIEVKIFSDDAELLAKNAEKVAADMQKVPGLVDVKANILPAGDSIIYVIDRKKAAIEGMTLEGVNQLVSHAFEGVVSNAIQEGPKMVGIRSLVEVKGGSAEKTLNSLIFQAPDGHSFPLRRIASIERVLGEPSITRENLKRMVTVTGRLNNRDLGSAAAEIQKRIENGKLLSKGVYFTMGGLYAEQQSAFSQIRLVMATAAALVFVTLLLLYEDFLIASCILAMPLLAVPFIFFALFITKTQLNISSLMGLTMIIGIVTEVGIFYFSEFKDLEPEGDLSLGLTKAGVNRMRPIAMTSLAAILTLLPLALGIGDGAAMQQPLAIVTVAGLLAQLPLVLIVMPVIYFLLKSRSLSSLRHQNSLVLGRVHE